MRQIKVLVIDDSAFMRKMISDILNSDPSISVIATARNGKDGIEKAAKLSPDVITLDIEMPIMNGLDALKSIMENHPVPVIMLSSITQSGADSTIQALNLGAVDFIAKPSGPISLDISNVKQDIIDKVKNASKANYHSIQTNLEHDTTTQPIDFSFKPIKYEKRKKIVGIGVSTGGPRALESLLTKLPEDFPSPILIVQHMPSRFTKSLADRLNKITKITVKEAEHGEFLKNGTAYLAPGDFHLKVKKLGTSITAFIEQTEAIRGHRPSVDILFNSIANLTDYQKFALVLTGMGTDGSNGIKTLKEFDPKTTILVESEESSIVFGMPKAAINTNFVDQIAHIKELGQSLCKAMER